MKILINERLSEHRCKTPEGYLICTDAILARTGKQTYRKNEIFKDSDDETEIEVDRTEDEVFSPQTLASFENKPVTVEHPDEDVNVHNYKEYAVGFVRDVRRGVANGQPVILGNLVITDEQTIQEIENGEHTDLSCGYDCDIVDEANPCQRNIRGNHVALCECGRAGIARIVDSKVDDAKLKLPIGYIETTNSDGFHYITRADHARLMPSEVLKIEEALRAAGISAKQVEYDFFDRWIRYKTSGRLASHGNIDSMKDANHLPAKVKRDLQKFLNHKSTFISNKDYDIAEFVKEFERVSRLWAEFPLKIVRESIKGWFKTGDGMMRKDYVFSIEGYDDRFMVSIYAKPDTYETTELNAYFTDSAEDVTQMRTTDSMKDAKYVIMHPRKNLYLTVGAKTWSDESNPMIKKFDSEKEAEEYAKKNTSDFRIAVFDSVKDALIPPTKESINKFESLLRTSNIKIEKKGLTTFGRVHYQVSAIKPFDQFVKILHRIDDVMDKLGIPMTFNAGADAADGAEYDLCTAGIDLDKQYVKDAIHDSLKDDVAHISKPFGSTYKEQLFTVKHKQGDTMYIHKVRASSIEDAISKVKDDDDINKLQQLIAETLSARADAWRNDKQKEIKQAKENIANAIGAKQNIRRDIKELYTLPEYVRRIAEKEARSELKQYDYLLNIQNKIYEKYSSLMREAESLAKTIEAKYNVKLNLELNRSGGEREAIRILKTMRK